jgi:hypothetical protein
MSACAAGCRTLAMLFLLFWSPARASSQEPTPETGNTLYPGGAFLSYGSLFQTRDAPAPHGAAASRRPTFAHQGRFIFAWGFHRDFDLMVLVPVETISFHFAGVPSGQSVGGTGIGDTLMAVKYRFLRRDSGRGSTQAAVTFGPRLPTGRRNLRDSWGVSLPTGLQPGTGSTGFLFGLNGTYTGLFHVEKLVADLAFAYAKNRQGSQQIQLGDTADTRFFLSYRPYQTHSVEREWWIGPTLTWTHAGNDSQAGVVVPQSSGDILRLGGSTFFSPHPGVHLWFSAEFPVAQTRAASFSREHHRFSFGITKQFGLPLL